MGRFVEGTDRGQTTLFPECLEDWICEDNSVRVIEAFVEELDLADLRFSSVDPEATTASVAIDGSKFKAVNNRDKNFTRAKMERRLAQIEESVTRYLEQLDRAQAAPVVRRNLRHQPRRRFRTAWVISPRT
jgi:hypothetical protein